MDKVTITYEYNSDLEWEFAGFKWWRELDWQSYKVPDGYDRFCNDVNPFKELVCMIDRDLYITANDMGLEWFYKLVAFQGYKVQGGIEQEFKNIIQLIGG